MEMKIRCFLKDYQTTGEQITFPELGMREMLLPWKGFLCLLGSLIGGARSALRHQTLRQHDMAMKQQNLAQFSSSFCLLATN